jgi:hypothetical protein
MSPEFITKSLNGNCDYKNKNKDNDKGGINNNKSKPIVYGGTKKKLRKIMDSDQKILDLLQKIKECRDEKW